MSDLAGNPEDQFSHNEAQMTAAVQQVLVISINSIQGQVRDAFRNHKVAIYKKLMGYKMQ